MKQQSFAVAVEFERFQRATRRGEFLAQMNVVVPWTELVALIEPHYPKGEAGRPLIISRISRFPRDVSTEI